MVHLYRRLRLRCPHLLATGAVSVLLLVLVAPGQVQPAAVLGYSAQIDQLAAYEPQVTCTAGPRPGTVALARWLQRKYRATGSLGIMRACSAGGTSEHKDGRAFDWAADVARPSTRRAAYDFITKALATDAAGNTHALARRLGIMYFIYNDTIWSSYRDFVPRPYLNSACPTRKRCSRTLRHLNHVHISLGYAGAFGQTSWYRARNVASLPVLYPGTKELDPDNTAVTGFSAPATGKVVSSPYYLRAGVTYRVVVTGTVSYADGSSGDANCIADSPDWTLTDRTPIDPPPIDPVPRWLGSARVGDWGGGWPGGQDSAGSQHEDSVADLPLPTTHGLLLAGALRWGADCRADHTYEAWYTPAVAQRLQLGYADAAGGDNTGSFSVYIARDDITAGSLARK